MITVSSLMNTSADDCKISLTFVDDLDFLREALSKAVEKGFTTKIKHIQSRIRLLERKQ